MLPGRAVRTLEQRRRVSIINDLLLLGIVSQWASRLHGEIRQDAGGGGDVPLLNIRNWPAAFIDSGEEI